MGNDSSWHYSLARKARFFGFLYFFFFLFSVWTTNPLNVYMVRFFFLLFSRSFRIHAFMRGVGVSSFMSIGGRSLGYIGLAIFPQLQLGQLLACAGKACFLQLALGNSIGTRMSSEGGGLMTLFYYSFAFWSRLF